MSECKITDCCNPTDAYHSDQEGFDEARDCEIISISTAELPSATVGSPYSFTLSSFGGEGPFTWAIVSGALPDGLTLSTDGVISGTATTTEVAEFTVSVTDANGNTCTAELSMTASSFSTDMIYYLRFNTAGEDSSGNGRDFTDLSGTPNFGVAGFIGNGMELPAGLHFLQHGSDAAFAYNGGGLTLVGWLKRSTASNFAGSIHVSNQGAPGAIQMVVQWPFIGNMEIAWGIIGTAGISTFPGNNTDWTFFACRHNPANNKFELQTGQGTTLSAIVSSVAFVCPGGVVADVASLQNSATALLYDEVALWHRYLTDAEIAFIFNGGAGTIIPL